MLRRTMIRRFIVYLVILTFLNLVITPHFTFAETAADVLDEMEDKSQKTAITTALILLGAIVLAAIIVKAIQSKDSSSSAQKFVETSKQLSQKPDIPDQAYSNLRLNETDDLITPSGNLVVFRW